MHSVFFFGARDQDEIMKIFALFDEDGTGGISFRNLKRVATELGENLTDDELQVKKRAKGACFAAPMTNGRPMRTRLTLFRGQSQLCACYGAACSQAPVYELVTSRGTWYPSSFHRHS